MDNLYSFDKDHDRIYSILATHDDTYDREKEKWTITYEMLYNEECEPYKQ